MQMFSDGKELRIHLWNQSAAPSPTREQPVDGQSADFGEEEREGQKNVMGFRETCRIGPLNMESPGWHGCEVWTQRED